MSFMPEYLLTAAPSRWWTAFTRSMVSAVGVIADALIIIAISGLMGAIYHEIIYGDLGPVIDFFEVGALAAGIFALPSIMRGEYALANYFSFKPHVRRAFTLWNVTFLCLLALGFVTKMTEIYSRGSLILFYVAGLPAVMLVRYALVRTVIFGSKVGLVAAQRVFLIGTEKDINTFLRRYQPWNFGLHTVGAAPLSPRSSGSARQALEAD